jgi:hypothetical protein
MQTVFKNEKEFEEFYMTETSKICALLSPNKMVVKEQCIVPSLKKSFQKTSNPKPKAQLARLLDPQFGSLISKNKSGDLSAGNL